MTQIEAYKKLCSIAGVPQILIDYPKLIFGKKPTKKDIKWAESVIERHQKGN